MLTFKDFRSGLDSLLEATIVGAATKYGTGHELVLKDKLSGTMASQFTNIGYVPGKSIFKIADKDKTPDNILQINSGTDQIALQDATNKILLVTGSASSLNTLFNHYSKNAKSNTNLLTELKELISMYMFESAIEDNKILSEDDVVGKLDAKFVDLYNPLYYSSALKQTLELKKFLHTGGYTYERQSGKYTKDLYATARKLSKKANDNWNPADVWMIKAGFNLHAVYNVDSIEELNTNLAVAFQERNVIPISLKQITKDSAKLSVTDPNELLNSKLEYDFKFSKVDLSDTFANFIIHTNSGFLVRCGFKASASTLNVSLESRFNGAGFQLGAVDAKDYPAHIKNKFNYSLRNGKVSAAAYETAKHELQELFNKYPRLSNTIHSYADALSIIDSGTPLTKNRFINLISFLYSFLVLPKNEQDFEENMKFCYFSSKKITSTSALYIIIQ